MIIVNLGRLELQEEWSEHDPSERLRSAFALHRGMGTDQASVVYFELEPGGAVGTHTDSAEEVVLVLEGAVQIALGDWRLLPRRTRQRVSTWWMTRFPPTRYFKKAPEDATSGRPGGQDFSSPGREVIGSTLHLLSLPGSSTLMRARAL